MLMYPIFNTHETKQNGKKEKRQNGNFFFHFEFFPPDRTCNRCGILLAEHSQWGREGKSRKDIKSERGRERTKEMKQASERAARSSVANAIFFWPVECFTYSIGVIGSRKHNNKFFYEKQIEENYR